MLERSDNNVRSTIQSTWNRNSEWHSLSSCTPISTFYLVLKGIDAAAGNQIENESNIFQYNTI